MKKRSGYLAAAILLSFIYISSNAQDYYQPAVFKSVSEPSGKISIMPNPVTANSYFDLEIDSSCIEYSARLLIYNLSGIVKEDKILKVQKGDNKFEINLGGYDPGNYVVRVIVNNAGLSSYSRQLVVRQ